MLFSPFYVQSRRLFLIICDGAVSSSRRREYMPNRTTFSITRYLDFVKCFFAKKLRNFAAAKFSQNGSYIVKGVDYKKADDR